MIFRLKQKIPSQVKGFARLTTKGTIWKYRQATCLGRSLPDFIIIGAQKSGTTSLFGYLSQHPQLVPSFEKEVLFFDGGSDPSVDSYKKGASWYRAHFPWGKSIYRKSFEASPRYIFNPLVPQRIAQLMPEVKLIALLRNPTERALSHYFHQVRAGREQLSIHEALQKEEERLGAAISEMDYKNSAFIYYSYKARGLYKEQLERYFRYFPMGQMLVMSSEAFFAEPASCLRRIYEFVGVDADFKVSDLRPLNVSHNRVKVDEGVYEYLDDFFRLPNQGLYDKIGDDFGWG